MRGQLFSCSQYSTRSAGLSLCERGNGSSVALAMRSFQNFADYFSGPFCIFRLAGSPWFPCLPRLRPCANLDFCAAIGAGDGVPAWILISGSEPGGRISGSFYAGVAQLVEHLICNQRVGGSNPFASSTHSGARAAPDKIIGPGPKRGTAEKSCLGRATVGLRGSIRAGREGRSSPPR
jgi:hypothetical protein